MATSQGGYGGRRGENEDDFEISIHEERSRHDNVTGKLKELLHEGDKDNNGTITWAQLDSHLSCPEIKYAFKKLDLEPWHLQSFFDVLKAAKESGRHGSMLLAMLFVSRFPERCGGTSPSPRL